MTPPHAARGLSCADNSLARDGQYCIGQACSHAVRLPHLGLQLQLGSRGFLSDWTQFMMRTRSGEPVFAFELWHERLLPAAAVAARRTGG